ncbi:MAG: type VI secretion system amidase immunity protein Tai4, partial [Azoarcus sp.]|nr:type VI secretion system amidase immunity protein Tai4 [Azoarcus sp.]
MKKSAFLMSVALVFGGGCAHATEAAPPLEYSDHAILTYPDQVLLKNWALSRCIAAIAKNENAKEDAYSTAGAYFEFAAYSLETYAELDALVNRYVRKRYSGSMPSEFNTMKCIDMFHSQELEKIVMTVVDRAKALKE